MTAGSKKGEHRGGRKKGTPNKATVERHLEILKTAGVDNYSARLGRDVLAKVMVELDALAEKYHPARGPEPDEDRFVRYALMSAKVAGDLTPYQSPRLAAMMMQSSDSRSNALERIGVTEREVWPAPGSADTELGVLMEPEVCHGETEVYTGVQA